MFADTTYVSYAMGPSPLERASFFVALFLCSALLVSCGSGPRDDAAGKALSRDTSAAAAAGETAGIQAAGDVPESTAADTSRTRPLEPRTQFPSVNLLTLDGEKTNTRDLLREEDSIVIFIQIGCESCEEVMAEWKELVDTIPVGMNVFAITEEDPGYAADYVKQTGFPFPLYCDDEGIFNTEYKVGVFPTVVGVVDDGRIAYVGMPITVKFRPVDAWKLLQDIKMKREAAGL